MADPRTFTLIGDFRDNISPALEKINKQIATLKQGFAGVGSRKDTGFRGAAQEIGKLVSANKNLSKAFKEVGSATQGTSAVIRKYREEIVKATRATRDFQKSGGNLGSGAFAKNINAADAAAKRYLKTLQAIERVKPRNLPVGGGGSGGKPPVRPPSPAGGGYGGGAASNAGVVAGFQAANMMTSAIVKGFQLGSAVLMKPFQYGANAMGERIRDEMTDIQSAGGLFAIDRRKELGLFKSFEQARVAQEAINLRLAKSAAALPGATAEYVQEAKKVTDTMIGALAKDEKSFMKLGVDFGAKAGDKMDALGAVIQRFTEKAVLLGKGSGGQSRMYGMPQLLEMMVNQENFSVQGMQKFSVLRGNPMLQQALREAEAEIAKTGAGTADRLRAIMKVLDEALPNEVVQGMKNSMEGVIEVMRSSFLDPEVGLFGLGRKLKGIAPAVDNFGRYVDESGKVVNNLSDAAQADLSLFMLLRDAIGGFMLPLSELAQILPEIFDPLRKVGESLKNIRTTAQKFYANFNQYTAEFEALAKEMGGAKGLEIKRTAGARGALLSIANLLRGIGAINTNKFAEVSAQLQREKPDLTAITGDLFKTLFSSDLMKTIGEAVGNLVGSVIKATGDLMSGVTDFANAGPFAKGLKKGWDAAQGSLGISKIFSSLFKIIGNVIVTAFKSAPFEMSILTALTVGMPILSGLITAGMTTLFNGIFSAQVGNFLKTKLMNLMAAMIVRTSVMTTTPAAAGAALSGAGGAAAAGAGAGKLLPLLGKLSLVVGGIIIAGGGLTNSLRQIGDFLSNSFSVLGDIVRMVASGFGNLDGQSRGLVNTFDLLRAVLFPITAALQAVRMTILAIRTGFDNLAVGFTDFAIWIRRFLRMDTKDLEKQQAKNLAMREQTTREFNEARNQDVVSNESIRYSGMANYSAVLQKDIQSLKAKMATTSGAERKELNDKIYMLNKRLSAAGGSQAPATTPSPIFTPPAAPVTPPAPSVTLPSPPVTPPAPPVAPPEIKQTAQNTSNLVSHSTTHLATATATGQAATQTVQNTSATNTHLTNIKSATISISNRIAALQTAILGDLNNIQAGVNAISNLLSSGNLKVKTDFNMPGGLPGGGAGGPALFGAAASKFGLQMTSGYRPGDPGYHGLNRARDYSNGSGPTPQMMAFAQYLYSTFGANLKELIYTPLGFSIKNGQKVPPYAQSAHYNHVHVAWAYGPQNPVAFGSMQAAQGWENSMTPGSLKVASVTANSGEGFGTTINGGINVSVQAGNVSDPDQLAALVALKIGEAVADARASSIFV